MISPHTYSIYYIWGVVGMKYDGERMLQKIKHNTLNANKH